MLVYRRRLITGEFYNRTQNRTAPWPSLCAAPVQLTAAGLIWVGSQPHALFTEAQGKHLTDFFPPFPTSSNIMLMRACTSPRWRAGGVMRPQTHFKCMSTFQRVHRPRLEATAAPPMEYDQERNELVNSRLFRHSIVCNHISLQL